MFKNGSITAFDHKPYLSEEDSDVNAILNQTVTAIRRIEAGEGSLASERRTNIIPLDEIRKLKL